MSTKYYPCLTVSSRVSFPNVYYKCSSVAYSKEDAIKVINYEKSRDSTAGGTCLLVEKKGPFGWFSKFPKSFDIAFENNMLEELNCNNNCGNK
jgi:hypothetical protein